MITPIKYTRRTYEVEVVEVTTDNMSDAAVWCDGKIKGTEEHGQYIKVPVRSPQSERQTRAYKGDFILKHPAGFKVYTPKAFNNTFVQVEEATNVAAEA